MIKPNNNIQLYVAIYNNDSLKITPQKMQEFFTKERFKYEEIKLFLHRWDYKIEMSFDTKSNRTVAIEEVKKLKNDYNIVYRYDFTKNTKTTQHLMNMKEYNKLINLGTQHRSEESEKIDEEKVDKETLQFSNILNNKKLLQELLLFELKQANKSLRT